MAHNVTTETEAGEEPYEIIEEWPGLMDESDFVTQAEDPPSSGFFEGLPGVSGNSSSPPVVAKKLVTNETVSSPNVFKRKNVGTPYPSPSSILPGVAASGDLHHTGSSKKKMVSLLAPTASVGISRNMTSLLASPTSSAKPAILTSKSATALECDGTWQFTPRYMQICPTPGCDGSGNKDKRQKTHRSAIACPLVKSGSLSQSAQTSATSELEGCMQQKGADPTSGTSQPQSQPQRDMCRPARRPVDTDQHLQVDENKRSQEGMKRLFFELKNVVPAIKNEDATDAVILNKSREHIENVTTLLQISQANVKDLTARLLKSEGRVKELRARLLRSDEKERKPLHPN